MTRRSRSSREPDELDLAREGQPAANGRVAGLAGVAGMAGNQAMASLLGGARDADHPGARLSSTPPFVEQVLRSNQGQPLPESTRAPVEQREGVDLSHVRVHDDAQANAAAANAGALAFAHGPDIYLSAAANTNRDALISHELGHVMAGAGGPPVIERYPNQAQVGTAADLIDIVMRIEATQPEGTNARQTLHALLGHVNKNHGGLKGFRYFETELYGWIDIKHFCTAADMAADWGETIVDVLGFGNEVAQWMTEWGNDYRSGFSAEDIPSNSAGSEFGDDVLKPSPALSEQLSAYLNGRLRAVDPGASKTYAGLPPVDQGGAVRFDQLSSGSTNPNYVPSGKSINQ